MGPKGRRFFWFLTMVAFLFASSGCTRRVLRPVNEEIERGDTGIHKERGQPIESYLLNDGTMAEYKGWVRFAEQDSLAFWTEETTPEIGHLGIKKKIKVFGPVFALAAVKALGIREKSRWRSLLLGLGLLAAVFAAIGLAGGFDYDMDLSRGYQGN